MATRTAVVAGTATAVSGRVARRQASRYEPAAAQQAPVEAPQAPPPVAAPAQDELTTQLQNLAKLHGQGVLSDEEFAAAKARCWGSEIPPPLAVGVTEAQPYARLAAVYDEIVVDPCYDRWAAYLHELWSADDAGVRTVLDVGCGTGLMAGALKAHGCRVTGVDSSSAMLGRARQRLGLGSVLIQRTLPALGVDGVFDAVISTFDALNYLTPDELRATLAAVAARLRPAGWLVFDLHTDAMLAFTVANPVVAGTADGQRFVISSVVDPAARTVDTRIQVTRSADGDTFAEGHRQYFHRAADVLDTLLNAGFAQVTVTDEYSDQPADTSTLRATWATRRARDAVSDPPAARLRPLIG